MGVTNKQVRKKIKDDFQKFYKEDNYSIIDPVAVNSKIDPSVFLVGSCTNVFKHKFLNNSNGNRYVLVQPSLNSKYLTNLYTDNIERYGSFYVTLGVLDDYSNLDKMIEKAYLYLTDVLGFSKNDIKLIVNSSDEDILNVSLKIKGLTSEIIEKDISRNHFGEHKGCVISGRTMRFNYNNRFSDSDKCIANISIYEYQDQILGIEMSSTVDVLHLEKANATNTNETSVLMDLKPTGKTSELKLYECISAIGTLLKDGVYPNSSKMTGRILKKYNQALKILLEKSNVDYANAVEYIKYFVANEYEEYLQYSDDDIGRSIMKR